MRVNHAFLWPVHACGGLWGHSIKSYVRHLSPISHLPLCLTKTFYRHLFMHVVQILWLNCRRLPQFTTSSWRMFVFRCKAAVRMRQLCASKSPMQIKNPPNAIPGQQSRVFFLTEYTPVVLLWLSHHASVVAQQSMVEWLSRCYKAAIYVSWHLFRPARSSLKRNMTDIAYAYACIQAYHS